MRRPHHGHSSNPNPNPNVSEYKAHQKGLVCGICARRENNKTSQTSHYRSVPLACRPASGRGCGTKSSQHPTVT
eukprot:scaffold15081_cov108-Phaeocystis_antarctica.AAC.2